jgi:hypothetical protein
MGSSDVHHVLVATGMLSKSNGLRCEAEQSSL